MGKSKEFLGVNRICAGEQPSYRTVVWEDEMRNLIIGLLLAICSCAVFAQRAKVVQLSQDDATRVYAKWRVLQDAQKAWDEEQKKIATKYTYVRFEDKDKGTMEAPGNEWPMIIYTGSDPKEKASEAAQWDKYRKVAYWYRSGWEYGFEFTDDFKFIVPKKAPEFKQNPYGPFFTTIPATTAY
jgi:hypothetical protein